MPDRDIKQFEGELKKQHETAGHCCKCFGNTKREHGEPHWECNNPNPCKACLERRKNKK